MRKILLPAFLVLLMLFAFTACDDSGDSSSSSDDSSSFDPADAHYMTMPELATIVSIFGLMDDVWDFDTEWCYIYDDEDELIYEYALVDYDGDGEYDDGVYYWNDDDDGYYIEYIFIDSDGDEEYDEGEQFIYYYEVTDSLYDGDDSYAYYDLFDYSDDDSVDSLYGTLVGNVILDGYSEYLEGESDSYKRYYTVKHDYTAKIGGEEHTLVMTVEYTRTQTKIYTSSSSWEWEYDYNYTSSDVVLDGVTLYGYEDYMNVLKYYS